MKNPKLYDISMEIRKGMAVYKDRYENNPGIESIRDFENSDLLEKDNNYFYKNKLIRLLKT